MSFLHTSAPPRWRWRGGGGGGGGGVGYNIQLALVYRVYISDLKEMDSHHPPSGTNDWQFIVIVLKKECKSRVGLLLVLPTALLLW